MLMGCAGDVARPAPSLDHLETLFRGAGHTPTRDGEVLRSACGTGDARTAITAQASPTLVYLATNGWFRLSETTEERGVVLVLTQIAMLNHELTLGKLALNPASGEVILSVELEAADGLGDATFRQGLDALCAAATQLRPRLSDAATKGLL